MRVLLVEDDHGVGGAIKDVLDARGHPVEWVTRGADALLRHRNADLLLLDLGLPDISGLEVLRRLRRLAATPVLVLTAMGTHERDIVRGLRLGADDYLIKPVRMDELLARMEAILRRTERGGATPVGRVQVNDIAIDLDTHLVTVAGEEVVLTRIEFEILAVLARKAGAAVSREQLLDEVWGDAYVAVSRTFDVHLSKLRKKLGRPSPLHNIRGFGYRLGD
ncbi:response regulator with CheY-like receiver domain and winged-helix DNA-binding domain [Frankia torreyi]|uniref:Two-component system response regulator n=2 Tax=Frankia TaxID=1854 RepID=Q0RR22_FRAAA|nr:MULTISPECIES: response regulator transcription factor [Frankia]KJE23679.1 response regulator with CheY-like receiver domain and winged-helix DNA-binding domain [Frankia torreyi]KQC39014.1 transcriptional regulator [Frankia sp. ACN1ag]KQM05709.1 response regulator with CheY-like receiver domain and winged-helix DNA-binding domain [Frankia sp. CpI1-P]CAJ60001.1 putative two-component system response regulator [Frankia alni ACN14a]